MGPAQGHIWCGHLSASAVGTDRSYIYPNVSSHIGRSPPLQRWVRLGAHLRDSSEEVRGEIRDRWSRSRQGNEVGERGQLGPVRLAVASASLSSCAPA
jgi:hypothetical protein